METLNQKQQPCENTLSQSFWHSLSSLVLEFGIPALVKMSSQVRVALRDVRTSLATLSNTLRVNNRLYFAIVLMLVVAPLSNVFYQLFDNTVRTEGWYYENYFYYFYLLSPWFALLFFSTGLFLLFPTGSKRAYLTIVPITSAIVKILWLHQITSNEEFHQVIPTYFILPALLISFIWLFLFDWLLARKYHKHDGIVARIDGLFKINIPADEKIKKLKKEWSDYKTFNKQY